MASRVFQAQYSKRNRKGTPSSSVARGFRLSIESALWSQRSHSSTRSDAFSILEVVVFCKSLLSLYGALRSSSALRRVNLLKSDWLSRRNSPCVRYRQTPTGRLGGVSGGRRRGLWIKSAGGWKTVGVGSAKFGFGSLCPSPWQIMKRCGFLRSPRRLPSLPRLQTPLPHRPPASQ